MNYWHIQLHPDDKLEIDTIKSILTTKKVIGMGESWNDKNGNPVNDPKWFRDDMKIGDVVRSLLSIQSFFCPYNF